MKQQQGVVLIVSLVILLVVTLLGTVAMQGTALEFKMAKNTSERQRVFQATEAALRRVEQGLQETPYSDAVLDSDTCAAGSSTCFENTCTGGLCFFGQNNGSPNVQQTCQVVVGTPASSPVWFDSTINVWQNTTRHEVVTIDGIDVKYIIEFRCYVDNSGGGTVLTESGDAFYRITAMGTSASGRLQVMLQSTYSVPS